MEHELASELAKMCAENLHGNGTFSPALIAEINKQIEAIAPSDQHCSRPCPCTNNGQKQVESEGDD